MRLEFYRGGQKCGNTKRTAALRQVTLQKSRPSLRIDRSFGDKISEKYDWILDRPLPAHKNSIVGQVDINLVGQTHFHPFAIILPYATNTPLAASFVKGVDSGVASKLLAQDICERHHFSGAPVDRWGVEVFNDCLITILSYDLS
ncbi:hypothetical protein FQZ97_1054340 [compost metagenome]|jgi:hypothetical protein